MPPLALTSLLQSALPSLSADGRAVLTTLACYNGRAGSAQAFCETLGLRSRFQLNRMLHNEGLPPYEELSGWVCVLYWMLRADAGDGRGALLALARQTDMETASTYRLVRRVTGHRWKDLRRAGTAEVVRWFQRRVQPAAAKRADTPRAVGRQSVSVAVAPPSIRVTSTVAQRRRVTVAGAPYGIALRGADLAYVTLSHGAAVGCLDPRSGRITGAIPVGCTPTCVAFDPSGLRAYVTVQFCDEIAVIDAVAHVQIQKIPVPGNPFPVVVAPSGRALFVTTNTDRLLAISTQNGRAIGSVALPATSHHLALHPAGDRLYIATRTAGSVLEVDANRLKVLRTFALGGWPQGLAVSPDGSMLYVANEQHELDVVQVSSGKRVARVEAERAAVALAVSPDHRLLYTGHPREGQVGIVDLPSLTVRGRLVTGGRPGQIAFDGSRAVITNEAGWIDFLPAGTMDVVAA